MSRRKGELSKYTIDTRWPHQVALRADQCTGHNYRTIHYYHASTRRTSSGRSETHFALGFTRVIVRYRGRGGPAEAPAQQAGGMIGAT